ncbi:MAG: dihydropteroate synthase [Paludibacteraceae bacterium]|nr:dihydropteroate synthase [Paludibacteraceae bacterium]
MNFNANGLIWELKEPIVMGILNVTPDSFYENSRCTDNKSILKRAEEIVLQGGKIIDIGGYSSRPGCDEVSEEEELHRVTNAANIIRTAFPEVPISIDTFRAKVAEKCVTECGASIINDISGGEIDNKMFETVAKLGVPYILMHMKGNPQNMTTNTHYSDFMKEIFMYFAEKTEKLRLLGVKDIILDPGFGFSKTIDQNYELLDNLEAFSIFKMPILVGFSRKRMIWQLLDSSPTESLNGTSVLNSVALMKGANIIRVHDVKEAVEVVKIHKELNNCSAKKLTI